MLSLSQEGTRRHESSSSSTRRGTHIKRKISWTFSGLIHAKPNHSAIKYLHMQYFDLVAELLDTTVQELPTDYIYNDVAFTEKSL